MHDALKKQSKRKLGKQKSLPKKSTTKQRKPTVAEGYIKPTKPSQSAIAFKKTWKGCKACPLHKTRDQIVLFDAKSLPADILYLGEAPGKQEDDTGTPFVGKSGQLLRQMLTQLKLDVGKHTPTWAIANTVCCIPLDDDDEIRVPSIEEQQACFPRLMDFIFLCQPKLVVLLGEPAKKLWKKSGLNKTSFDFTKQILHNLGTRQIISKGKKVILKPLSPIPSLELRHPAYLLRNGASDRREFSENYNGCIDLKRDYLKLRDEVKRLATSR